MDDIEAQFIGSVTNQMGRIDKSVTDGQNSEKSGLSNQKTTALREQIARQMASKGANVDGGYNPPSIDPNTQLEPLQITPEMIKEIRELEDDILPEMKKSGANIIGNPSFLQSRQQGQIPVNNQNTPQLEFNFEQKTIDTIYEKLDDLEQKMEKQFKVAKQLLEAILNDKKE
jgi:hypothetical protein